ncbi:hypothetical protein NDU88_007529 [Pleurodeles waltl]|uniref:Uncharacterized protein n=1 Tax=Pleurodeles waltl TaxID=8319 RepID=A0AAV7QL77_PLEWA|nr:hypothetical protein NDU88_007529 [Pleurodeles waltl]
MPSGGGSHRLNAPADAVREHSRPAAQLSWEPRLGTSKRAAGRAEPDSFQPYCPQWIWVRHHGGVKTLAPGAETAACVLASLTLRPGEDTRRGLGLVEDVQGRNRRYPSDGEGDRAGAQEALRNTGLPRLGPQPTWVQNEMDGDETDWPEQSSDSQHKDGAPAVTPQAAD